MTPFALIYLVAGSWINNDSLSAISYYSVPIVLLLAIAVVVVLVILAIILPPFGSRKNKAKRNTIFH